MKIELTTESSMSSYGIPVARIDGADYGPGDFYNGRIVADVISEWAEGPERNEEEKKQSKKFLSSLPRK